MTKLANFNYHLPPKLIAQNPVSPRDTCRLMYIERNKNLGSGEISDYHFYDLPKLLQKGDVLIFNNSKVIPARILFEHKEKKIEIFLIRSLNENEWLVLGKPGKLLQTDTTFQIKKNLTFEVKKVMANGERIIKFSQNGQKLESILEEIGHTPFPPYIKAPQATSEDYQTIYAEKKGSVAAPTAGLHFTNRLLKKLESQNIQFEFVTLHVGLGTFQSIKTNSIEEHHMHEEIFNIDPQTAKRLTRAYKEGRRLIAVGTTSVRVLESAFDPKVGFSHGLQTTSIYIYPGYQWQCVRGLITNFHLPKSSLLLLASSFSGKELIMKAYQEGIKKHYRFYSFGDAMFIV